MVELKQLAARIFRKVGSCQRMAGIVARGVGQFRKGRVWQGFAARWTLQWAVGAEVSGHKKCDFWKLLEWSGVKVTNFTVDWRGKGGHTGSQ